MCQSQPPSLSPKEWIYVYVYLIHSAVHLKQTTLEINFTEIKKKLSNLIKKKTMPPVNVKIKNKKDVPCDYISN